ncbi:AAA family ATPase [Acinetobacter pullicarnis]|uniref:AAA family ATPase n=1 Tax=Acinetobacter pullicarnis TaxID=2576829 RepID=UPI001123107D|nr:AAA family ATPase [Acinetobacter pullicarnis]
MYLKYLKITDKDDFSIRNIDFKKGVNIIEGVEINNDSTSKTNSLGKTTLLRCIDFCLLGKWQSIIFDKELKNSKNDTVFSFFKESLPHFELLVAKDFDSSFSPKLKIRRQLMINPKAKTDNSFFVVDNYINDVKVSEEKFQNEIKKFLFGLDDNKPTLRQLVPKFIRTSDHQITNIIKYLHPTTSGLEYETLHLFLFDFPDMQLIHNRAEIENQIDIKEQEVKSLENLLSTGKREINDVKKIELGELQAKYDNFQISKEYERENDELGFFQGNINKTKAKITTIYLDMDVWTKRLLEVNSSKNIVNSETIEYMYKEAGVYNVKIQRKFEETIKFHNEMLKNEVEFINKSIHKSKKRIKELENEYSILTDQYTQLLKKLGSSGSLAEYTKLGNEINELTKQISETESLINQHKKTINDLKDLKSNFDNLTVKINEILEKMRLKLAIFNRYFSEYSKVLTNDSYIIFPYEDKLKHITLVPKSENNDSHTGDGIKQSIIVSFDLAYVSFKNDLAIELSRPSFFTQDKIEIIDVKILDKL